MPTTAPDPACFGHRWRGEPLSASHLRLRRLEPADAPRLVAMGNDWEVARSTAHLPHPLDASAADQLIATAARGVKEGAMALLGVERLVDHAVVGAVGFRMVGTIPDLTCWIGQAYWGAGLATEAIRRLTRMLFTSLDVQGVTADVLADNEASARMLTKAGFSRMEEGCGCEGRCRGRAILRFRQTRAEWEARWRARPTLLVAAAALIDPDGRVLMARRPLGKSMAGLWEFPGGKVHGGETPEGALVRELREELAIDITDSCLAPLAFASHPYEDFHLLMPLYACRVWKGTVTALEGQELKWTRPVRLADLPMPPADVPLVPLLRDILG